MRNNTKKMVGLGLLTAIVIVLQVVAVLIRPTGMFSISLVLVPIVVGAALYGYKAGAWLGFVFSVVVLMNDSALFLAWDVPGTIVTVLVKGTVAGLVAGLVYLALEKKNRYIAVIVAAMACPVTNTGLFVLGCRLFFWNDLAKYALDNGFANAIALVVLGFIGINFIVEMVVNMILSPTILRIININKKDN